MNAHARERNRQQLVWSCCAFLACAFAAAPAWAACPKLLMTAGVNIHKQTDSRQAAYWGDTVGVQGFMVNYIATDWQTDVGTNPDSATWKLARRFQSLYSRHGVTDNFVKIGLYRGHDWRDAEANRKATRNLAHAAALARYAGMKGLALDLEPYKPSWVDPSGDKALAKRVQAEGRKMGQAMHDAFPGMTLFVLPDVLREAEHEKKSKGGDRYLLAAPFVRGLLSIPWAHVVIGTEFTYSATAERITPFMQQAVQRYAGTGPAHGAHKARDDDAPPGRDGRAGNFSIAPGLWPLGPNAKDKSARESPEQFKRRLQTAFATSQQYVWIFGSSSAWQKDGPLGPQPGPVATSFPQFLAAIHQVKTSCAADASSPVTMRPPQGSQPAAPAAKP